MKRTKLSSNLAGVLAAVAVLTGLGFVAVTSKPIGMGPKFSNSNLASNPPGITQMALTTPSPERSSQLVAAYGKLPLGFEINQGQTNPEVKFLSRGADYQLFLTSTEAVMVVGKPSQRRRDGSLAATPPRPSVLRIKLVGSNPDAELTGTGELAGKTNYLIGRDAGKWHTNIPQYSRVRYQQVYPGVDLVYYGNQGRLEHDFVIAPGADLKRIRLALQGATAVQSDTRDGVALELAQGQLHLDKPFAYQEVAGLRHEIASRYVINGNQISFEVGEYDHNQPLVIDPVLSYLSYLGGSNADAQASVGVAVDSGGNAYIATGTLSTDYPVTAGAFQQSYGGSPSVCSQSATNICGDAVVTKINPTGTALIYSTYLGGASGDYAYGLAVDPSGNAYVAGYTESSDFPITQGAFQTKFAGRTPTCPAPYFPCGDGFITKLNPSGSRLVYSTYLGGSGDDYIENLAIDHAGEVFVTGSTDSADFPVTAGALQTTKPCAYTLCGVAFVTKLNPAGSALQYSTYLGGSDGSGGGGIAVDSKGEAYVGGGTGSLDFPITTGAFQKQLTIGLCGTPTPFFQCPDAFFTKLNFAGNKVLYSTYLGGKGWESIFGLTVDSAGNAYLAGFTASADFPTTAGSYQPKFGGGICNAWYGVACSDAVVFKINPSKSGAASLVYSTFYGGNKEDQGTAVAVNSAGDAFVTGWTFSDPRSVGGDAYLVEFNAAGAKLLTSQLVGGAGFEAGDSVALDGSGHAYIAGQTQSTDLPTTAGAFQAKFGGGASDCFIAQFKGF